jgi:serine/threonine protein kinase
LHEQGIVYRDLKPENVLVQDNGHIMLSDFDLSLRLSSKEQIPTAHARCSTKYDRFSDSNFCFKWRSENCKVNGDSSSDNSKSDDNSPHEFNHTRSHSLVGTREYIAPEILWCTGHSFPVDWWAFGIFLYEMINGRTPFSGANRKETFFNIMCKDPLFDGGYSALQDLIEKLLVKEPSKRLGSLRGVEEVKDHEFFHGLRWDEMEFVYRPPFVPALISAFEIDPQRDDQDHESHEIQTEKSFISDDQCSCSAKSTLSG